MTLGLFAWHRAAFRARRVPSPIRALGRGPCVPCAICSFVTCGRLPNLDLAARDVCDSLRGSGRSAPYAQTSEYALVIVYVYARLGRWVLRASQEGTSRAAKLRPGGCRHITSGRFLRQRRSCSAPCVCVSPQTRPMCLMAGEDGHCEEVWQEIQARRERRDRRIRDLYSLTPSSSSLRPTPSPRAILYMLIRVTFREPVSIDA